MTFSRFVFGVRPSRRHSGRRDTMAVGATAAATGDRLQRWEWAARAALAELGVGYDEASGLLAFVRQHCLDTGQTPCDRFGSPASFAAEALACRRSSAAGAAR